MEETMIKATHEGPLKLGNVTIWCAVLENGDRVLTQEGFLEAIGRAKKAKGGEGTSVDGMPPFMRANNLKEFISDDLGKSTTPIIYRSLKGGKAFGYKAELLLQVCYVFIDAKREGKLSKTQSHIASQCEILVRGFATVGITALIDEATGYQEVRDRLALQAILDKFLTDEYSKWTKMFEEDYYKELYRLHGSPYPGGFRRPGYIGHWTNDIVYSRLAPGILKKLRELNPRTESGHRARQHHRYFTGEYGVPELRDHISNVIFLMKSCTSWDDFKRRLARAAPKYGDTIEMDLGD